MITTLTGANFYELKNQERYLIDKFVADYGDMAVEVIDGEEAETETISGSLESLPFLSLRKLVVLKEPSKQRTFIDKAEQLFSNVSDTTDLILVEPKLDKRLSYYKLLQKKTDFQEFKELDMAGTAKWLTQEVTRLGGNIGDKEAKYLVDRVGLNQELLANELNKLVTYNKNVTLNNIELLIEPTPQSTIFELIEAAFTLDNKKMLKLYREQKALKVEPQQIIALLTWQFHILALIKSAGNRTPSQIAKETGLNPYVISKSMGVVKNLSYSALKGMISNLLSLDVALKSKSIDADNALQQFLISISN